MFEIIWKFWRISGSQRSCIRKRELDGENGAAILAKQLTEHCTTLRVFIGRARNPGYEGKDVPLDLDMKLKAIDHLCALLEEDGKRVEKNYY